ncbi:MAG: DUF3857 domain-containing transglutaminase family protein [Candidatus Spyradosoma sp.]
MSASAGTEFEEAAAKADYVVLADETRADVNDDGSAAFSIFRKIRIVTPAGAFANRIVKYGYDPQTAEAKFASARVVGADGSARELDCAAAHDRPAPAREIYWPARQIVLEIGRLNPGDVLEYRIEKRGFSYALLDGGNAAGASAGAGTAAAPAATDDEEKFVPPMRGEFYDVVPFWNTDAPVAKKVYAVAIRKPLQYRFCRGEARAEARFLEDGRTEYRFVAENLAPFRKEPNMVDLFDAAPKLLLSTTRSWREKSLWFHRLNEESGSFRPTPAAQRRTDEIVAGAKDDREKVARLTHWVADNMRYSGISMGKGEGYTLHPTDMNFTDLCGVCKDKASLLVAMLRMAGFEACAAMTMADSRIDDVPADHFNHCVALVKLDGEWTPLDPTWAPFERELWSSAESQQHYLPGVPEGSELRETPVAPAENHYLRVSVTGTLAADGTLEGEYALEAEGQTDARLRRPFIEGHVEDWAEMIGRELRAIAPNVEILGIELGNDWRDYLAMPLRLKARFRAPGYAAVAPDGSLVYEPVVFRNVFPRGRRHERMDTSPETRRFAFRDSCSRTAEFSERVALPFGAEPRRVEKKTDGAAASFAGTLSVQGEALEYTQKLTMNKRVYEPEDWPAVRDALRAGKAFAETPVVLKKR